jgi:hypothetical protein
MCLQVLLHSQLVPVLVGPPDEVCLLDLEVRLPVLAVLLQVDLAVSLEVPDSLVLRHKGLVDAVVLVVLVSFFSSSHS